MTHRRTPLTAWGTSSLRVASAPRPCASLRSSRRSSPGALGLIAALCVVLGACKGSRTLVTPPSFDRPGQVAFACFEIGAGVFVPLSECAGLEGTSTEPRALTALVTQTARGEVAAVDLQRNVVLDSDLRVPGYTFIPVGEAPTGLVVPPDDPRFTYVASFGARTLQWVPTVRFRPDAVDPGDEAGVIGLDDGPTDLVLTPDSSALLAPLPREGRIVLVPRLPDGTLDAAGVVDLPLDATVPDGVTADVDDTAYAKVCVARDQPVERFALKPARTVAPRTYAVPEGATPRPTRLRVDDQVDPPVLLVADETLPVIHRFALEAGTPTPLAPIATGVPVTDLAITPVVPATVGGDAATEPSRYLYAIDATDQTVLVVDYLEGSPTFGAVLPVSVGGDASDRIDFRAGARTIEVIRPDYPGQDCSLDSDLAADVANYTLRGVFVSVGLLDGTLRLVDVHDLDAPCRGGAPDESGGDAFACQDNPNPREQEVFIRRHRPRVGEEVQDAVALTGTPNLDFGTNPGTVDPTGQPVSGVGPSLADLGGCPPYMERIYPEDQDTVLLCALGDPWGVRPERWTATWEGPIPNARGGRGRLHDGLLEDSGAPFCRQGVLGAEDVVGLGEGEPEAGYPGDLVFITSDLPPGTEGDARCEAFDIVDDDPDTRDPIGFEIRRATASTLELGAPVGDYTLAEVVGCFPELVSWQIHVGGAYAVVGSATGFLHRVTEGDSGECTVDLAQPVDPADPDTYRSGRALSERQYINPMISFQLERYGTPATDPDHGTNAELRFTLGDTPLPILRDVGRLPQSQTWSATDGRLYVVDVQSSGLVQLDPAPLQVRNNFE